MSLFENAAKLFDLFVSDEATPEEEVLAERSGVSREEFRKVAGQGLPAIFQGINKHTTTEEENQAFAQRLTDYEDADQYDSIANYARNVDADRGNNLLDSLFDNKDDIINRISSSSGVNAGSVQKIISMLAPIVMGYFGEQKKSGNLNLNNIGQDTESAFHQIANVVKNTSGLNLDFLDSFLGQDDNPNQANDNDGLMGKIGKLFK